MVSLCDMLSAEDLAASKVAVEICNNPELKREILCTPDVDKKWLPYDRKHQWYGIVDKKATALVKRLDLPECLQKKVTGVVLQTGMRMLTWAEYHEGALGLSREYSSTFLNRSFFTQRGIIDNKKAAGELMSDKFLSIEQKYKLACLYCFTDHIAALYRQMTNQDKKKFYDGGALHHPNLGSFWSYSLIGEVDGIRIGNIQDLVVAVLSGCNEAVEYCLDRTNLKRDRDVIVEAAVQAVRSTDNVYMGWPNPEQTYRWIPARDYYINIFCFLLSRMTEDQQINVLKKYIDDGNFIRYAFLDKELYRILGYFLDWPYQYYFMKMAKLMWEFLSEEIYYAILLMICDKIEFENLKYGEEKSYYYGGLLKEFWRQSSENYKKYVISNQTVPRRQDLLGRLLSLRNFTHEYRKIIELILASATVEERENITFSKEWKNWCFEQMRKEKWEVLDWFAVICDSSKEKFRTEFIFSEEARKCCLDFVENDKWDAADSFVKWSSLAGAEADELKREIFYSNEGRRTWGYLFSFFRKWEKIFKFIEWSFPFEENSKAFKELILSFKVRDHFGGLVGRGLADLLNEFISLGHLSEEEITELKKNVAYETGGLNCGLSISEYLTQENYPDKKGDKIELRTEFQGGKWEEVEMFVTWCFTSEEEISDFKKNVIRMHAADIHFRLIRSNQWEEAETFFMWLGLSKKEIKKLKKDTLYEFGMREIDELLHERNCVKFVDYAYGKWEIIELYLRWCLTDKETALEFKEKFDEVYGFKSYVNETEIPEKKIISLNKFYSLIEELLNSVSLKSEETEKRPEIYKGISG